MAYKIYLKPSLRLTVRSIPVRIKATKIAILIRNKNVKESTRNKIKKKKQKQ